MGRSLGLDPHSARTGRGSVVRERGRVVAARRRGIGVRSELVDVTIDSVAAGGDGVGRLPDGRVVFVPYTAPGDRARVRIKEDRGRFVRASLDTLIHDGPTRCEPLCPVFGRCGGCAWQHIRYEDQLEAKRKILGDALTRIGRFELDELPSIQASPQPYHYRSRTRVLVEGGLLGYRRRRSRRLCSITSCPVLVPSVDALLSRFAEAPETWTSRDAEERESQPGREGAIQEEWELCAGSDGAARSWRIPEVDADEQPGYSDRPESDAPAATVKIQQGADSLQISPGVFMQVNALLWPHLVEGVARAAAGSGGRLIELFAGAGFFTLALSRCFSQVVAIESSARAVFDLRANLAASGIVNVEVIEAAVEEALRNVPAWSSPDCVVLDPPRSGLTGTAIERLAALDPQRIVYLSCDPATLARDLRLLCEAIPAYRLTHASAFDLFPQTPHVEGLTVLEQLDRERS